MTTLLSLIGEQPIPVLLVHRALRPRRHILLHTETTRRQAMHLAEMLLEAEPHLLDDAYDLPAVLHTIRALLAGHPQPLLNLTAGTKPMAWAGYEAARQSETPFVYLQSEGQRSVLYRYGFTAGGPHRLALPQVLPSLITLEDYLQAHGLSPHAEGAPANDQERTLADFFAPLVEEMRMGLQFRGFEIDFLLRRGNRVAVVEAKDERAPKRRKRRYGLDQLTTIAGREHLGTYTGKIWVLSRPLGSQLRDLAQAYRVQVVVAQRDAHGQLTPAARQDLAHALDAVLGPRSTTPSGAP